MEALQRLSFRLRVVPISLFQNTNTLLLPSTSVSSSPTTTTKTRISVFSSRSRCLSSRGRLIRPAWFEGTIKSNLPNIVKAGDPVLHEPAKEVGLNEINSERVQKIIDDMISVMRKGPGVGLAAPQIGIPLRIIVLEDKIEYISLDTEEVVKAQERRPFDLLVILNPKLKKTSNRSALFF